LPYSNGSDGSNLKGVQVLVVEDNWSVAGALKSALERLEMSVIGPAATIAEARRLTATNNPRLAVVDMNLKGELACDLIEELHARGTSVVVVTGYTAPAVAMENVVACLRKPVSVDELIRALRAAMSARSGRAETLKKVTPEIGEVP
jgi:ActR/RegA family two-component response regulator